MAFVLDESASYTWPVKAKIPTNNGKHSVQTFNVEFKRITQSRVLEMFAQINKGTITDMEICFEVILGWDSVTDGDGNPLDFNQGNLKKLLDVPTIALAIGETFFNSINGGREKN
tara:strand:- start:1832 stop:2176 length:345 start_codon:yes stop_codon:yes gene_type:complete